VDVVLRATNDRSHLPYEHIVDAMLLASDDLG
jgi:hypothetical protein